MKTYTIKCIKCVEDYLSATVTVEADTEEEAREKAVELAEDQDLYRFYSCGDTARVETEVLEVSE